ncbi:LysR family transcriptional regulator ArgP [Vibrio quintilis]|uniref:Putative HTH-type transcriptional regulator/MT2039 n=1 Tax=Vibrio quintilis TaxID=1117707 RepID=A0A1M7YQY7_9VIBR|nr:LysR family transcriptional regulator ArgP [Vibrio quintilis]SHO54985.1 putative HTH-type transcriptional regulator/MT2039 [Vibrio quintilis]
MSLVSPQIVALITVIEERSFEAAARRLSVTPSAISQRIRTLEDRVGQLLVVRQAPCRPTPAGQQLLTKVRPMLLLEAEAMAEFHLTQDSSKLSNTFSVAVNEDSLSTWLISAFARLQHEHGYLFDIRVDDQDFTLDHLREGSVIGAITSEATPLQGCAVHRLGNIRYCAIASPEFAERYFSQGLTAKAFAEAPVIVYNRKDPLQSRFMHAVTSEWITPAAVHYLPDSLGLVEAASRHMGWTLAAEGLMTEALAKGQIINLVPDQWLDGPLYWQHAAIRSVALSQITDVFYAESAATLHR